MPDRVFGRSLLIDRGDISQASTRDLGAAPQPEEGQALFAVRRAALTANNVTYAAMGERMGYWRFFPGPEGSGVLPVWGFADCVASAAGGIDKGDRFYGYWPLAEQLLVEADRVDGSGFVDPSAHRQGLADAYNRYNRRAGNAAADNEAVEALFRPLFTTGWLLAREMQRAEDYGARQVVMSSASSKTALGAAWTYAQREGAVQPELIGLTSPGNVDFTRSTGLYGRVLTYSDLEEIAADRPTAYIDFAGNLALRHSVHERFGSRLGRSIAVGLTHWTETQADADIPPPEAKMFFAPTAIEDEQRTGGRASYVRRNEAAWAEFSAWVRPHVEVRGLAGIDEAAAAYRDLASGQVGGAAGLVVELN